MWATVMLGGYAVLVAIFAVWSARVAFRPRTKPEVRLIAFKIFRIVWPTGALSGGTARMLMVKLQDAGFL